MRNFYPIFLFMVVLVGGIGFQRVISATEDAQKISLADAKKDFDEGNATFVDSRNPAGYNEKHIKGAINIPFREAEKRWTEIPTDKKIIVYCS